MYQLDGEDFFYEPVRYHLGLLRDGKAHVPGIFIMFSDDFVREALDSEEYQYWMEQKRIAMGGKDASRV